MWHVTYPSGLNPLMGALLTNESLNQNCQSHIFQGPLLFRYTKDVGTRVSSVDYIHLCLIMQQVTHP